jgi:hypothetical protein
MQLEFPMKKALLALTLAIGLVPMEAVAVTYPAQPHHHRRVVHRRVVYRRSTRKSIAIVAGSAATGAAIGGLGAGPIGAGIGAIAGGASGFIYDRATHKKVIVQ